MKLDDLTVPAALRKQAEKSRAANRPRVIALASTFTADPAMESIELLTRELGMPTTIEIAPYDQVFQELLGTESVLGRNRDGTNVLLVRVEDWLGRGVRHVDADALVRARRNACELVEAVKQSATRTESPHVVIFCPAAPALDATALQAIERDVERALAGFLHVDVITSERLGATYPVTPTYDAHTDELGHVPYTLEMFAAIGTMIVRRIYVERTTPYKVLALDCDHTLWRGVVGEDGAKGVVFDAGRQALQALAVAQQAAGVIVCLCSKNNEADVWEVFDTRPEMTLQREHLVTSRINWAPKSANLRELAAELNLGLDSFVFLDDNAQEIAEVREHVPEVLALEVPTSSDALERFVRETWVFDRRATTDEDRNRTQMYVQEIERRQLRRATGSLADFLAGLELEVLIEKPTAPQLPRVVQLIEKTNQFNTSTVRRTSAQLADELARGLECSTVTVRDRFGDYGLVGVVLYERKLDVLHVDSLLLSCRVLGKGVEHRIVNELARVAEGARELALRYVHTAKSVPARAFLESIGGERTDTPEGALYRVPIAVAAALRVSSGETPVRVTDERNVSPGAALRARAVEHVMSTLRDPARVLEKLRATRRARATHLAEYVAPSSELERQLADIWTELLRVQRVGLHDDFFAIGGHSLVATQVVALVRKRLGVELAVRDLFEAPSIEALARRAIARRGAPTASEIQRRTDVGDAPLSSEQERIWFLEQLEPGTSAWTLGTGLRVTGALDAAVLERAVHWLVARHETLRTRIVVENDVAVARLQTSSHDAFVVEDWTTLDEAARAQRLSDRVAAELGHSFDLAREPLFVVTLIRLDVAEWALLIRAHHIIADGVSVGVFVRELAQAYGELLAGAEPNLPPLPIQYADYAAWQRTSLGADELAEQLAYWRENLAGVQPLQLRTDPSSDGSTRDADVVIEVSTAVTDVLRRVGSDAGATPFMTMLAAVQLLLGRLGGTRDVAVGMPIANRDRTETQALIGMLLSTLVLRVDQSGTPTFVELLERVREATLAANAHHALPFERVVAELAPERGKGLRPFFDILVNGLPSDEVGLRLPGLEIQPLASEHLEAKYPMTFYLSDGPRYTVVITYQCASFSEARMRIVAAQLSALFEQIAARPHASIETYTLEDPSSVRIADRLRQPLPRSLHLPIWADAQGWATRQPDAIAVRHESRSSTYGALIERAERIARWLARHVASGEVVAVAGPRCIGLVTTALAVMRSGGVLLLLDPALPLLRRQAMMAQARVRTLVRIGATDLDAPTVLAVDPADASIADAPAPVPLPEVQPTDAAYVFFTSGTTGTPKGVIGTHQGLAHFLAWERTQFDVRPDDRSAQLTALSFDVVLRDLFLVLTSGATLCLPPADIELGTSEMLRWMADERITLLHIVPSIARSWLHLPAGPVPNLRWVFFAGEPLTDTLIARWRERFVGQDLANFYGPTETSLAKCYAIVGTPPTPGVQAVGRPLPETQVVVLEGDRLCGIGEPGEIVIRTPFRSRGYLAPSAEDAARFVANPFRDDPDDLLYRTGDLGRMRPDGELEILGRRDHQVKVRGVRVELGEVEAVLGQHADVRACVARTIAVGEELRLIAYVVPGPTVPAESVLRDHMRKRVVEAMVPSTFVFLDAMPLNANGKIDRRALPEPTLASAQYVAPHGDLQRVIAEVWSELLRVERVGATDDFFSLGGHSLLATQMVSKLRARLGVELSIRALFEAPTVAELGARLEGASLETLPPLVRSPRGERPALSYAQERLWFLDQLEPGSTAYHMPAALRLEGDLDVAALEHALSEVVARHEALRTTFAVHEGVPYQVVHEAKPVRLVVEEVTDVEATARAAWSTPFDLTKGPLLRVRLLRVSERAHVLVVVMHHIVSDAWSLGVLVREVAALYAGQALPPLAVQYADYAAWQRAQGERIEREAAYWKQQLAGAPALLELPTDRPRPAAQSFVGARVPVRFTVEQTAALNKLARAQDATLFMVLLAAWQLLLSRYSGQKDIVVGSPIANRTMAEVEPLIGFFVNTLALRTDLSGKPTFAELLARVRETTLAAYEHQDVPFERVVEAVNPPRSLSHTPMFQVMLILQNAPETQLALPGVTLSSLELGGATAKYELTLSLAEVDRALVGSLEYATALFDEATIRRLIVHWQRVVDGATANAQAREVALLTADETRVLRDEWNATRQPIGEAQTPEQIVERARQRPDALALECGGETLTYGELEERSGRLAEYLVRRGVKRDELVGVCLERSVEMVVSLLAVWRAGAAYVPLDPAYPRARLELMLEDSGAKVLLTQRSLVEAMHVGGVEAVCIDELARLEEATELPGARARGLAYVIYTSGSTGKPKGVQIEHESLTSFLASMAREPGLEREDVLVAVTSLSFDISNLELWLPLVVGAKAVVATRAEASDGVLLQGVLTAAKATVLQATPSTFQALLAAGWRGSPGLRVLCGGEALPAALANALRPRVASLTNLYGPTETTIWSSLDRVEDERITIGRPIENTWMYVVDEGLELVPVGVAGELCIGGAGLARGYRGRAELTGERFVPNPFARGERMYRTGDRARWRGDGRLEYLGRLDHQVKVRGFRIELGEIEAVLGAVAGVRAAVVLVRAERLVAYVVCDLDLELDAVRAALRERLPDHMVPAAFVKLEALPLTSSGKVDRKALPQPKLVSAEYVAPRDERERAIAEVWQSVLGVERVGAHDDFFALGGHSLLAMRIAAQIRKRLGVELRVRDLFEASTVAELAVRAQARSAARPLPLLEPVDRSGELPIAAVQEPFFGIDQGERWSVLFHAPRLLRIDGHLDHQALERAFTALVVRHEALRTSFHRRAGGSFARVEPAAPVHVPLFDIPAEGRARALAIEEHVIATVMPPFTLDEPPLFRARVLRAAGDLYFLTLAVHHIANDGWSVGIFTRDLVALYLAMTTGREPELPPLTIQAGDFAVWQARMIAAAGGADREWWLRALDGAPREVALPFDRPRAEGPGQPARLGVVADPEITAALARNPKRIFALTWGAATLATTLVSGAHDLVVGTVHANRDRAELMDVVGCFINFVALRARLDDNDSMEALDARFVDLTREGLERARYPFGAVIDATGAPRRPGRNPLYNVYFHLVDQRGAAPFPHVEGMRLESLPVPLPSQELRVDLSFTVFLTDATLGLSIEYDALRFDASTMEWIAARYFDALRALVLRPHTKLAELRVEMPPRG